MTIRKTVFLTIGATFLGFFVVLSITIRSTLLPYFDRFEKQMVYLNLDRAISAIESNFDHLDRTAKDLARLDETYAFAQTANQEYIKAYLSKNAYADLGINLLAFLDPSGKLLYGNLYNQETDILEPLPEVLIGYFEGGKLATAMHTGSQRGIIPLDQAPLMLMIHPILPAESDASPSGKLVIGQFLTQSEILRLGGIVQLPITIIPYYDPSLPKDFVAARQMLESPIKYATLAQSEDLIAGFSALNDIEGNPAYLLRVEQNRAIFQSGQVLIRYLITILISASIMFVFVSLAPLEGIILSPLSRMSREVTQIGESGDLSQRLTVKGKDELARLARHTNTMLEQLQLAQEKRRESEARFRTLVESMNDMVFTYHTETETGGFLGRSAKELGMPEEITLPELRSLPVAQNVFPIQHQAFERCQNGSHEVYEWSTEINGKQHFYQNALSPIFDRNGNVTGVVGVGRDITSFKQLEENLHQRIAELAMLYDISQIFLSQPSISSTNDTICRLAVDKFDLDLAWIGNGTLDSSRIDPIASCGVPLETLKPIYFDNNHFPPESEPIARAFCNDEPLIDNHVQNTAGYQSIAAVPLFTQTGTPAILNLFSKNPDHFTPQRLRVLLAYTNLARLSLQNACLYDQLEQGRRRLETISRRLVEIQEDERKWIAMELHDEIGQILTGLKLLLDSSISPGGFSAEKLAQSRGLVYELISRVRQISLDLRPAMLDDLGLIPAVLWLCERFREQTGVQVHLHHEGLDNRRFSTQVETTAFRVIQEALTNVARHAQVNRVTVQAWTANNQLNIQVKDEGIGFDPENIMDNGQSRGLMGIRERAHFVGGFLTIESAPGTGTNVNFSLPLISQK